MPEKLRYQIGEKIVYPSQGIGVIEDITAKTIQDEKQSFYVIKIVETGVKIMTPLGNADKVGIREISNAKNISKALKILKEESTIVPNENWNRRQKKYLLKLKTGSILDIAEVYRDLSLLQLEKSLSFGEKKILENVGLLLSSEIAAAKDIETNKSKKMIEKAILVSNKNRSGESPSKAVH